MKMLCSFCCFEKLTQESQNRQFGTVYNMRLADDEVKLFFESRSLRNFLGKDSLKIQVVCFSKTISFFMG